MPEESDLERRVRLYVEIHKGHCFKLTGIKGIPDRMIIFRNSRIGFLELKSPGKKPSPLQKHWLVVLRNFGFAAECADRFATAKDFVDGIRRQARAE